MRIYQKEKSELLSVTCNKCKKKLFVENGILKEGNFEGNKIFDYFSENDGVQHKFDLCEDCYKQFISTFKIPIEKKEITEFM